MILRKYFNGILTCTFYSKTENRQFIKRFYSSYEATINPYLLNKNYEMGFY